VISALWTGEPSSQHCKAALENAQRRGALVICAPVYCELHACPGVTPEIISSFLQDTGIAADFEIGEDVWREAASRFARYANRRRRSGGESPKRLLVDFIVGAHALLAADCLLTLDQDRYSRDFPELKLV
jgi:predicted nucleic acid-binding protein